MITAADYCGISVMTACRAVKKVPIALAKKYPMYIKIPAATEIQSIANEFYRCIDCTHVRSYTSRGKENFLKMPK